MAETTRLQLAIDEACRPWTAESPGVAVTVVEAGETVFEVGYGQADLAAGTPMASDTVCYVGSLAKQFTAAAVAMAYRDGALALEDRVYRWIPELPGYAQKVTVDQLLHHTAGIRDYFGYRSLQGLFPDADYTPDAVIEDLQGQTRLNFEPAERFGYSNTNYVLLSIVLERATGVGLAEFAATRIFTPLGMADTEFRTRTRPSGPKTARAYDCVGDGSWTENDPLLGVAGDGGLRSTSSDLARWARACMTGGLEPDIPEFLAEPGVLNSGHTLSYGRGLARRVRAGRLCLQHGGGLGGWRSLLLWFPHDGVGVAVTANASDVDPLRVALVAADVCLAGNAPIRSASSRLTEDYWGWWIDDTQGVVLQIEPGNEGSDVLSLWGRRVPLRGEPDGSAMADDLGFRFHLEPGPVLVVDDAGDPWGRFGPTNFWQPDELSRYAGRFRCQEFPQDWELTATDGALLVRHLPHERLLPVVADTFTSRATTLRFVPDGSAMTVDSARTIGFRFETVP